MGGGVGTPASVGSGGFGGPETGPVACEKHSLNPFSSTRQQRSGDAGSTVHPSGHVPQLPTVPPSNGGGGVGSGGHPGTPGSPASASTPASTGSGSPFGPGCGAGPPSTT